MTNFIKNLQNTLSESQYNLCMQNHETDLKYQQLEKEYSLLFDNIRTRLGKHRKLMLKLESLRNEIGSIDDKLIYQQGFIDCVALLKFIKLI